MLGERESHRGKKRRKDKGRRDREKKEWQTVWTVGERATDREGVGKIDTMEERESDKSGRDRKTVWEREQD